MSLTEIELDRLADYTVALLDAQGAAEVDRLIRTDDRWARAYEALVGADARVRADLATAARPDPTMPADVVARVDAALHDAASRDTPTVATVVSLDAARARRRRTMYNWLAASAAVVVALAGLGLAGTYVTRQSTPSSATVAGADSAQAGAPLPPPSAFAFTPDGAAVVSSGTNYATDSLTRVLEAAGQSVAAADSGKEAVPQAAREPVPSALSRLTDARELGTCLAAVLVRHPGAVRIVDYARFAGKPALIIGIVPATGSLIAVAVGELCGLSGADELAASTR